MLRYGAKCLPDGAALIRPTVFCRPGKRSATGQGLTHNRPRLHYPTRHRHVPPGLRVLVAIIRERGITPG
nr:hypothetical protein F0323_09545 [Enterobacter hormaechei]